MAVIAPSKMSTHSLYFPIIPTSLSKVIDPQMFKAVLQCRVCLCLAVGLFIRTTKIFTSRLIKKIMIGSSKTNEINRRVDCIVRSMEEKFIKGKVSRSRKKKLTLMTKMRKTFRLMILNHSKIKSIKSWLLLTKRLSLWMRRSRSIVKIDTRINNLTTILLNL